ncbi:hypothetical protein Y032_0055g2587 [Ancylostoma ceylanicum]|nr:hypothetical protein Y032_0055g2587 [Ancylostoma ceylanicum]
MNELLSWDIKWYFVEWHLSRYLVKALREDALTGPYTSCRHGDLDQDQSEPIPVGTVAYDKLAEIVLNQRFQNDICRLGPYGGTSQCETKNVLDRLYCPKEPAVHVFWLCRNVHVTSQHSKIAELAGERVVEIEPLCQRRFNDHPSRIVKKSNVYHKWRWEILDEYKRDRLYDLGNDRQTDDGIADLFEGFYDERLEEEIPEVPLDPEDDDGMESFLLSESDEEDIEMYSEVCSIETILPVLLISGSHIT